VLKLRILEGGSSAEVGALTNRSPAAVRQISSRALASLRAALDDQLGVTITDLGRD
jgi:DNA-directed RNA polymerase specialized sigma24 family protein